MYPLFLFLLRILGTFVGLTMVVGGVPLLISPIPFGLIMIVIGAAILIMSSIEVRNWVRRRRQRDCRLDARMRGIEDRLPGFLRAILVGTRPGEET